MRLSIFSIICFCLVVCRNDLFGCLVILPARSFDPEVTKERLNMLGTHEESDRNERREKGWHKRADRFNLTQLAYGELWKCSEPAAFSSGDERGKLGSERLFCLESRQRPGRKCFDSQQCVLSGSGLSGRRSVHTLAGGSAPFIYLGSGRLPGAQ